MVKLTHEDTQRIKTAFLSYSQGQPKVTEQMMDQLICGAIPGISWEELQAKKGPKAAQGYDRSAFFSLVTSDDRYVQFIVANFPPAPEEEKAPQVDALELKTAKGF
ncbi:uncharacterized protein TEOVI_000251600 [Trypanosoma equiperdum]|uniref:Uncharacterized protein n=4 Tax=Trypanozoon TaxID=39700 RepID=Q57YP4_TRYB2|nr:hypothetical protein, conserved [Trypanosoma brucei gambiense DAL972]XP_847473.1 hypothetical protein, conserved [Trypanosoma brucei brucei TREU927]AAX69285.1 hypothetical protein, conserved [Trypanosoma brucei]RHW72900.1 hypothetical protein DPX39_040053200 [Trypanosoma brucei equiperdum]SCU70941.1 hypothetical protein, conserved [Trypanosoma equiperdum]AAZ13407.1 hypothetical protein, conserved [Trypanosoma brucei brucei TREU927]CBH13711.1 hypothetical protein, conserved [Trypanosoma bru|eukprot:XP_011775987.1 hypothetical protein, conserved [Trypanosoma brucei gambiense DAL972]